MSTTSPQKRRHTAIRSSMLDQPMRTTRSMARISDAADLSELSTTSRRHDYRSSASSSQPSRNYHLVRRVRVKQRNSIPSTMTRRTLAWLHAWRVPRRAALMTLNSNSRTVYLKCLLVAEKSTPVAAPRQASTSPSADVGLPRSKTSTNFTHSINTTNTLLASRKENSTTARSQNVQMTAGSSPVKPTATLPRPSRLHGPTVEPRASSRETDSRSNTTAPADRKVPTAVGAGPKLEHRSSAAVDEDIKPPTDTRDSGHRLLFGTSDVKRNPFLESAETNSLAALGNHVTLQSSDSRPSQHSSSHHRSTRS